MCEHLEGGYDLDDWIEERCPWCEIERLKKISKALSEALRSLDSTRGGGPCPTCKKDPLVWDKNRKMWHCKSCNEYCQEGA